jgi:transcription elongation factor GreA
MNNDVLLTRQGYDKIEQELEMLITVRRKEVAARIKEAISFGDLSENSEYDSAKIEQAELEERILKLEGMLRKAIIIEEDAISLDKVSIGVKVKIKDLEYDEIEDYSIVGSTEADPYENKISNESPVGTALLGKKVGDVVKIQVPDGTIRYEVLEIYK